MSGVASGFATIAAEAFGVSVEQGPASSPPTPPARRGRPMSRRHRRHVLVGPGGPEGRRGDAGEAAPVRQRGARDRPARPRDRRRPGAAQGRARPRQVGRRARREARWLRRRLRAGRGARRRTAAEPARRRCRPTSPTSASIARRARSRSCKFVIAQDVGRALNPALVEGQMRGGVAQGIGWALLEAMPFDDQGQLLLGLAHGLRAARSPATCRRSRRSSSRCPRPTVRSAPRASARRPSAAVPRRSPTPSRTRSASGSTGCR